MSNFKINFRMGIVLIFCFFIVSSFVSANTITIKTVGAKAGQWKTCYVSINSGIEESFMAVNGEFKISKDYDIKNISILYFDIRDGAIFFITEDEGPSVDVVGKSTVICTINKRAVSNARFYISNVSAG